MHSHSSAPDRTSQSGIVNRNSPNHGNQAAGTNNTITQTIAAADPCSLPDRVTVADLLAALRGVRQELEGLRAAGSAVVPDADMDDALDSLGRAEQEAAKPEPQKPAIRRRISLVVDALASATAVATSGSTLAAAAQALVDSVAKLQAVFLKLFGG